jgi:hypothetical protein
MRGLATRRARWNPRLPLTVGAVVVLGAALPAAIAAGGATMLDDGVRSAIVAAGPTGRGVQVTARLDARDPDVQDRAVRQVLARTFDGVTTTTWTARRSGNLSLTGVPASPRGEVRLVAEVLPDVAAHARLAGGRWPMTAAGGAGTEPVPAALQAAAAETLGIGVGDRLTLGPPGATRQVEVVGLWRPADRADAYWFGDRLPLGGAERDSVRGPLLVAASADGTPPDLGEQWNVRWRVAVDPESVAAGDVERLATRLDRLDRELEAVPTAGGGVARSDGGLRTTLDYPRTALPRAQAATAAVLVLVVGLVALVAAQAAALLAAERARESGVLRARGASRTQLLRLTGIELLAIAVLAAVPAAALAVLALGSPLGPADSRPLPTATVAALACLAVALVVVVAVQVLLVRRQRAGGADAPRATLGAVLALAAVLGLALWQLWAAPAAARRGVDPVLVVAPAVALGASGVLVVRGLGPLVRSLGRLARRDGVLPGLVGWHAARRGTRPAAPLVAVVVVAAAAVVALSARATVEAAAADRTAAELGADVVVTGSARLPEAIAHAGPGGAATAVTPVVRLDGSLGEEDVQILAADVNRLPEVTAGAGRWALDVAAVQGLGAPPGHDRGGLALPPGPALDVTLRLATEVAYPEAIPGFGDVEVDAGPPPLMPVTALVTAPDGTQRSLRMPDLPLDARAHPLSAPLPPGLAGAGGVRLAALQVDVPSDPYLLLTSRLDVLAVTSGGRPAARVARTWQSAVLGSGGPAPETESEAVAAPGTLVRVTALPSDEGRAVTLRLTPDAPATPFVLPALLDGRLAERLGAGPGSTLDADAAGRPLRLRVAAIAGSGIPGGRGPGIPDDGLVPDRPAPGVLVDLAMLGELSRAQKLIELPDPDAWWVGALADGDARAVASTVRATADADVGVQVRADIAAARVADPFAAGLRRVLLLAALAALGGALGALLLGDAVAAAGRRTELVVLRALGLRTGQLRWLLVLERALVGGTALVVGLALGLAVAPVVVPALVGVPAVPGLDVSTDLPGTAAAGGALAAAVLAGALAAGRRAARLDPVTVLREDVT